MERGVTLKDRIAEVEDRHACDAEEDTCNGIMERESSWSMKKLVFSQGRETVQHGNDASGSTSGEINCRGVTCHGLQTVRRNACKLSAVNRRGKRIQTNAQPVKAQTQKRAVNQQTCGGEGIKEPQ